MQTNNLTLKMGSGGVPPGAYQAVFKGFETIEDSGNGFGAGLKWAWEIAKGDQSGRIASRITGRSPTPKNNCGKLLAQFSGKQLALDESFDLSSCVGKSYTIMVVSGANGGTYVSSIAPTT